ncbi:MAG TPA: hypothetical protein VGO22_08475 [Pseudorhizobium sp.]|nr:hypothetical protein [Pseudorhizobium sp.]
MGPNDEPDRADPKRLAPPMLPVKILATVAVIIPAYVLHYLRVYIGQLRQKISVIRPSHQSCAPSLAWATGWQNRSESSVDIEDALDLAERTES